MLLQTGHMTNIATGHSYTCSMFIMDRPAKFPALNSAGIHAFREDLIFGPSSNFQATSSPIKLPRLLAGRSIHMLRSHITSQMTSS